MYQRPEATTKQWQSWEERGRESARKRSQHTRRRSQGVYNMTLYYYAPYYKFSCYHTFLLINEIAHCIIYSLQSLSFFLSELFSQREGYSLVCQICHEILVYLLVLQLFYGGWKWCVWGLTVNPKQSNILFQLTDWKMIFWHCLNLVGVHRNTNTI